MKTVLISLALAVAGYAAGTAAGIFLIGRFSSNRHDRAVEAAMTGAFVVGPLVAIVTFAIAMFVLKAKG